MSLSIALFSLCVSGTSAATPGVLCLSGGSCSCGRRSSIGAAPVAQTNVPRDPGPHQGGVPVPADAVPQVGSARMRHFGWRAFLSVGHCQRWAGLCTPQSPEYLFFLGFALFSFSPCFSPTSPLRQPLTEPHLPPPPNPHHSLIQSARNPPPPTSPPLAVPLQTPFVWSLSTAL